MLSEEFKNLANMFGMVLVILAVDQDIINVYDDSDVEERSENILNQGLEGGWGIGESKGHDLVLIMTVPGAKSHFGDIILVDLDLVIARAEVNLGKYLGFIETINQIINQGNGKTILDSDLVQGSVVNAHAEFPILLFDKDDWGTIWTLAWFD